MRDEQNRQKLFTRRTLILGGSQLGLLSMLGARLYYLQVLEAERYKTLAEDNRINLRLLAPPRGQIVDRYGRPLATNRENYRLLVVPEQAGDLGRTLRSVAHLIDLDAEIRARVIEDATHKRSFMPITVRDNLTWEEVSRVEVNEPDLPGVMIDVGLARQYPYGDALAHVVGYVASPSERDLTGDPLLELPDFLIGKSGVERALDGALRGSAGTQKVEVNAFGRVIREVERDEGDPGADVTLTIDAELQRYVTERLGEESAAVVVMDIFTGEVLALVSVPVFDPNLFNTGLSVAQWNALVNSPRAPLTNKTVAGQYPPGSTFKMVVALAALESGAIDPDHTAYCPGHMDLGDRRFHCWKRAGHGRIGLIDALAQSCDVFFYDVARRVGVDAIAEMSQRFGLGEPLDVGLPGERGGLVPTKAWKQADRGRPWTVGETLITGIGQGYMLTTPLQLAVMTARLANGGRAVKPFLYRTPGPYREHGGAPDSRSDPTSGLGDPRSGNAGSKNGRSGNVRSGKDGAGQSDAEAAMPPSLNLSPERLRLVLEGMNRAVNHIRGTAHRSAINIDGRRMAGKTGTAQVRRITLADRESGRYKADDIPWLERDHALFVGYAPVSEPRYAVSVVIEHGGGGSSAAAPVGRDILAKLQQWIAEGGDAVRGKAGLQADAAGSGDGGQGRVGQGRAGRTRA